MNIHKVLDWIQSFEKRLAPIQKNIKLQLDGESSCSLIAQHAWAEQHHPHWGEISILHQADRDDVLNIKETFCITTGVNTGRISTETRELQSLIVGSHCCDAGNDSVLPDNQLYFDKCINHAFYSVPSASGLLYTLMKATVW